MGTMDDEIQPETSTNHDKEQHVRDSMVSMDNEIVLANLPTHEGEEQQNSGNPLKDADPIPEPPNQAIGALVTKRFAIKRSKLKFSIRKQCFLLVKEYLPIRIIASILYICMAITISVLTVYYTSKKNTSMICPLTFVPLTQDFDNQNSNPRSIAIGDFNNDTILDIVVANSNTDSIGILLGYGNGSFAKQKTYSTGSNSHPYSVAVEDFNHDHRLDIIVANYGTHSIDIFFGDNNGSFKLGMTFSTGVSRPLVVVVGYLNNDQELDFVVVNYGTYSIDVFLREGNKTLPLQTTYSNGYDSLPLSLDLGDFNNDNRSDIVVANYGTNNIDIFINNGNGSFTNQTTYLTGYNSHPYSVTVGDFNNDNKLDIMVANSGTGTIGLLLGTGLGTFKAQRTFITNIFGPLYIIAKDFNQDNRLDIIIANNLNNSICIILGDSNNNFINQRIYSTGFGSYPSAIATGDFNGDHRMDIVVTNNGTNNIGVYLAYDPGVFDNKTIYSTGQLSNPKSIITGDFNNDNNIDIAVANDQADNIGIFYGIGNGYFLNQTIYTTGFNSSPSFIATGDLNNDKQLDIIVANDKADNVGIFFGNTNGIFSNIRTIQIGEGSSPGSVALGDFNNDHCLDMAIGKYGIKNIGVIFGYCNGSFGDQIIYITPNISTPELVVVADMNNDKQLDIIVVDTSGSNFLIFYGLENGMFGNDTLYSSKFGLEASALIVNDINHDNYLDLIVSYSLSNNIGIFFGDQNETFTNVTMYSTGPNSQPCCVSMGDFNNDNISDIIVGNLLTDTIGIYFGFSNGTFADLIKYSSGNQSGLSALVVTNVNNDNRLDFIVTYIVTDDIAVYLGYDYGVVKNQTTYTTGAASQPIAIAVADFNHDNRLDVAIINYGTETLNIRLGYENGMFSNQTTYSLGSGSLPTSIALADFNIDSEIDIAITNFGTNSISIYYGYGDGTFTLKTTCSTGLYPLALAIGYINNDIWPDIVVANSGSDSISILLGYKYTAFVNQLIYSFEISSPPYSVVTGDVNNDTYVDIIVSIDGQITGSVFLGKGDGTFASEITFSTPTFTGARLIAIGKFNNDHCLDIVTVNVLQNFFSIFIGYCNGSFGSNGIYSTGNTSEPKSIVTGDFNNDNLSDIVIAITDDDCFSLFLNNGNGSFNNQTIYSTGLYSQPNAIGKSDFDKDNQLDIVVINSNSSNIGIFYGYEDGSFKNQTFYSTGLNTKPHLIALGDFNNDSWIDILFINSINNTIGVLISISNGIFNRQIKYSVSINDKPSSIAVNDFNNDHQLDIAITGSENDMLYIYFGNGNGIFGLEIIYTTGYQSNPLSLAIADFNNDNQEDIIVVNYGTSNIGIFFGYCCEPFISQTIFSTGNKSSPYSVALGDFNNDKQMDIVVANSGNDNIGILFGYDDGNFENEKIFSTGNKSDPVSVTVGDLNNDHWLDIIVANRQNESIGIYFGYGNGTFENLFIYYIGFGSTPYFVTVLDFNKDNLLDIVVSDDGTNNVIILSEYKNGNFGNMMKFPTGYNSRPYSISSADFNNQHIEDIVVTLAGMSNIGFITRLC